MLKLSIIVLAFGIGFYYYNTNRDKYSVPSPIVNTENGPVQGITSNTRDGQVFYEYFGIPYAKPPIAQLRYEAPQALDTKWTNVLDASKFRNECLQMNLIVKQIKGDEDCLYLNVFTKYPSSKGQLKPVFVWIHGGVFVFGSSNMYKGNYFLDEDIVLVTLNYRLGSLGFMNTGDGLIRGNMGLKDQNMALQWVKKNIAQFGGNPQNVILIGESAGAASVHHHLLSPMSKGLFAKCIMQSGLAITKWAVRTKPAEQAKRYATNVGCPTETTKEMVDCLKKASPEKLMEGHNELHQTLKRADTLFGPTIETILDKNTFVVGQPFETIKKNSNEIPIMVGYNSHEGLLTSPAIVRDPEALDAFDSSFNKWMPEFLMLQEDDEEKVNRVMSKARDFYFGVGERINTFHKFENYTNFFTDMIFAEAVNRLGTELQKLKLKSSSHFYYYSYKGKFTLTNVLLALKGRFPMAVEFLIYKIQRLFTEHILGQPYIHYGTCHGDEMAMQFKLDGLYDINSEHIDYQMSKKIVKLWASFAYNHQNLEFENVKWEPIEKFEELKYLNIDQNPSMISQPNVERLRFWKEMLYS